MAETNSAHNIYHKIGDFILDMDPDLKLALLFTLITPGLIYTPVLNRTILEHAFSLAMLFFIPGYAFVAALFPKNGSLTGVERAALSFGSSICICPLIELGISYTPWGLRLEPLVICLTAFTVICTMIASVRRHGLREEDRYIVDLGKFYEETKAAVFAGGPGYDRILTAVLILSIVLTIAVLALAIMAPRQVEMFTEFYVLGPNGTAVGYPIDIRYGDSSNVVVGIANHESRDVAYDLTILLEDGVNKTQLYNENIVVAYNQSWRKPVKLTPGQTGTGMILEFLLYRDGNMTAPYRECHFRINVTSPAS